MAFAHHFTGIAATLTITALIFSLGLCVCTKEVVTFKSIVGTVIFLIGVGLIFMYG